MASTAAWSDFFSAPRPAQVRRRDGGTLGHARNLDGQRAL
jgi:hypothetical protein